MTDNSVAVRVRALIIKHPTASHAEIASLWSKKEKEKLPTSTIRNTRSSLRKKLFGEIPVHMNKFSIGGAVRQILAKHPTWSDTEVIAHLASLGVETNRSVVSNARSVAKQKASSSVKATKKVKKDGSRSAAIRELLDKHPTLTPKEIVLTLEKRGIVVSAGLASVVRYGKKNKSNSPDPNQNAGPRARKNSRKQSVSVDGDYNEIERRLDELIQQATNMGNVALADATRHARRIASAAILN